MHQRTEQQRKEQRKGIKEQSNRAKNRKKASKNREATKLSHRPNSGSRLCTCEFARSRVCWAIVCCCCCPLCRRSMPSMAVLVSLVPSALALGLALAPVRPGAPTRNRRRTCKTGTQERRVAGWRLRWLCWLCAAGCGILCASCA